MLLKKLNNIGNAGRVAAMLVLSRKVGEKILIGDEIVVTVVRLAQGVVRIGVEAPTDLPIVRKEILEKRTGKPEVQRSSR